MRGLYLVTPDWDDTEALIRVTELALKGGAKLVQYRHKTANSALRTEQATRLLSLCRRYSVPLVINDFVALCLALDADGVHVGGTDDSVAEVRSILGSNKIVGASCYGSVPLACAAAQAGASYVALGGFFPSRVKQYPVTTNIETIAAVKQAVSIPIVVIGGMTAHNSVPLIKAGADMVAAISAIYYAKQPELASFELNRLTNI